MRFTDFRCRARHLRSAASVATLAIIVAGAGTVPSALAVSLRVSPAIDHPSATVQVRGAKFTPGEAVDVYFDTIDELLVSTNRKGAFGQRNLPIPTDALPGSHWITAIGRTSGTSVQRLFTVSTDWAQFQYSEMKNGANPYENMLSSGNVSSLDTAWTTAVSPDYGFPTSSPALANGAVYIGGSGPGGDGEEIDAFNATTGAELWSAPVNGFVFTSPAVANGIVYVTSIDGTVQALDVASGTPVWTETLPSSTMSPTVANGAVYVGCFDGNLYTLDAQTGTLLWSATTGSEIETSPAVVNGIVYFASNDGNLHALNAANGATLWTTSVGGFVSSSTVVSGAVYVGSDNHTVYALNAASGAVLWTVATGAAVYATPAVANGVVYVGSYDHKLYAIDATSGALLWTAATGLSIFSSAAVANGVVYVGSDDDRLYAFEAATGKKLWAGVTGAPVMSPAVANGMVYAVSTDGSIGSLHAYALNGGRAEVYHTRRPAPTPEALQPNWRLKASR